MTAKLTILIPNYNRAKALERLLRSVFVSVDHADSSRLVNILVIDDFSETDLRSVLVQFESRENFTFKLQDKKRGNAELAFLSSLEGIDTEYTWLLGNDDYVAIEAVSCLLRILDASTYGLVLLNPRITKTVANLELTPLQATSQTVIYTRVSDLFADWGFVTSTTTFPCLVFKTKPVAQFHELHRLTNAATVYAHTFTLFGALRDHPALFLSSAIVGFTLNEALEEQAKLERQSPKGIQFHHQSLGLARLIKACSEATGFSIRELGVSVEDEIDKNTMIVQTTLLSHFLLFFYLEQLIREQTNLIRGDPDFRHLETSDIDEIGTVVHAFKDELASCLYDETYVIHHTFAVFPEWKVEYLRRAQANLLADAAAKAAQRSLPSPAAPKKLLVPNFTAAPLRGSAGDVRGLPCRGRLVIDALSAPLR